MPTVNRSSKLQQQKMSHKEHILEWSISAGILFSVVCFPITSLRPVGALIFGSHWISFLCGRVLRRKHFQSEVLTYACAVVSHFAAALFTLKMLGHTGLDLANADQLTACMMLAWVMYRTSSTRPGRTFPYFRRGDPTPRRLMTWSGQALRTFVEGMPLWILLAFPRIRCAASVGNTNDSHHAGLRVVGLVIWSVGVFVARSAHLSRPASSSLSAMAGGQSVSARPEQLLMTMRTGVWRYSRHPDFFANFVVWCGIVCLFWSSHYYDEVDDVSDSNTSSLLFLWLPWISPLFSLISHIMFTIPSIERDEKLRFGHLPAYRSYLSSTWPLIPLPLLSNSETLLAWSIDADAEEYTQPTNRGAYKSSRADTITEALQASKAVKLREKAARREARQKAMLAKKKKNKKKREKTPQRRRVQIQ